MLTIVTFKFAPWLGPEVGGLISQPSGTSLRSAASDTLNAMPIRVSMLLPESFSWANVGPARSRIAIDNKARMVVSPWLKVDRLPPKTSLTLMKAAFYHYTRSDRPAEGYAGGAKLT